MEQELYHPEEGLSVNMSVLKKMELIDAIFVHNPKSYADNDIYICEKPRENYRQCCMFVTVYQ